ncbi:sensor histidine kinase [Photobacterium damselae subsp. damselae]|nr:sensor histidine kinase [Photobacterium damselae subsp. damselae]SPY30084.1 Sensor protein RstB [Photobacterium damselae]
MMRRLYIESFIGLIVLFGLSLYCYEVIIYRWNTDYDYVLEDYEAEALHDLVDNIYHNEGSKAAYLAIEKYATKTRQTLTVHTKDALPEDVKSFFFTTAPQSYTYHDDDRILWFRLTLSSDFYSLKPNFDTPLRRAIDFDDNMVWVFFMGGFALYSILFIWYLSRRVRLLEKTTLAFAHGEFAARARTESRFRVGTLNQSFNYMADKISNLLISNKALTNAIAHELRTPIFRIQWQAELLADSVKDKEIQQKIESIVEDTEEMESMVNELLYYAKVEQPDTELHCQDIVFNQYLNDMLQNWEKTAQSKITLKTPFKQNIVSSIDTQLFKHVLNNLVSNASRYSRKHILVTLSQERDSVFITVEDDGPGIPNEHWPYLFDPFYSADPARNKAQSGFGLGLAIAKQIVARHKGQITIGDSALLGGAKFTVILPITCQCDPILDRPNISK